VLRTPFNLLETRSLPGMVKGRMGKIENTQLFPATEGSSGQGSHDFTGAVINREEKEQIATVENRSGKSARRGVLAFPAEVNQG